MTGKKTAFQRKTDLTLILPIDTEKTKWLPYEISNMSDIKKVVTSKIFYVRLQDLKEKQ